MPARDSGGQQTVLSVKDLVIEVPLPSGRLVRAVDGLTFELREDEVLAIAGESGSGKSITMLAIMGLLPDGARVLNGEVLLRGRNVLAFTSAEWRAVRGQHMAMIFQNPMSALNPLMKVRSQVEEMVHLHEPRMTRREVQARSRQLLSSVGVSVSRHSAYPHEYSGGMSQRAMIAMAMAHDPAVLIADEPTTALDVTIQAQVLQLLEQRRQAAGGSMILITHDLGVVAESATRVLIMYAGKELESGPVEQVLSSPVHPYTTGLVASILRGEGRTADAYSIPGSPVDIAARPHGCVFSPRCQMSAGREICVDQSPANVSVDEGQDVACHFWPETREWAATLGQPAGSADTARDSQIGGSRVN